MVAIESLWMTTLAFLITPPVRVFGTVGVGRESWVKRSGASW
jgi:hypothetical protein